jgi:UDP-N-acetylglucosamine--N-acetylmuramyl-(pentapeptide) pyrophosphoryl-undecaprenol N-acetylglucosamine transferase
MNKKIIFTAGGTGGHIFPAINLMKHFFDKGYQVILVTDIRGNKFINNYLEYKSYILKVDTPTNKKILKKIFSIFTIFYSLLRSIIIIKNEKPDLIIGFGGYVSFPISYASKFFNIPLIIYENNLLLGRANKFLLNFAKRIFLAKTIEKNFPEKLKNKICEVGFILDKNIINYVNEKKKYINKNFSLLVLGGSQGAEIFGKIIPFVCKMLKDQGYTITIYQQCTKIQKDLIANYYKENNITNHVFEFERDLLKLMSSSNLAITRCGASTTAEMVHTLTPFIGVPLEHSVDNHQYLNAEFYEKRGCCWVLEEKDFNKENLFNLIIEIIKNQNKLESVKESMKKNLNKTVYTDIENNIKEFI